MAFTQHISKDKEIELDDGTIVILHPGRTWKFKKIDIMDSGRDILKLHNGAVYKGAYKSKDDKMVTFHVDDMPKAQSLPLSLIQSVTLSDGYSIFESSLNEEFKKELKNQTVRKTENSKLEKTKLTYVNTIDAEYIKNVKGGKLYDSYLAKNGALISVGDTLTLAWGQNPCEDKIFLELKEKKLDDMTDREYEYFKQKSTECAIYQNTNRAMQSTDNIMAQTKTWTTYYIFISVVGLLITLSMMP